MGRFACLKILLLATLLGSMAPTQAQEQKQEQSTNQWQLSADEWAQPRSGLRVAQMTAVRDAVQQLLANEASMLLIRYPGGETGSLWAEELRDWLVALGVPSARLGIEPGSAQEEAIDLILQRP